MREGLWKSREFETTRGQRHSPQRRRDAENAEKPCLCLVTMFESGSVLAQRFDGIHLAGAAGWDEAGGKRGGDEQGDHHCEG